ncbi:MAG: ankyrin repeat protein [Limisphaerales bacterium]|jgi:ankyrin repeat protein
MRKHFLVLALVSLFPITAQLRGGNAALADAVEARDSTRVAKFLADRPKVNAPQVDGMSALHWAAYHDDANLGQRLLKLGANASAKNRYGITPLYLACVNGNADLVGALLESGADSNAKIDGGETALMTAARTGKVGAVAALLDAGAKVDAKERREQTAIMWAAAEGHVEVVDALLSAGADFETPLAKSGFTPFFFAVREGETEVVRLLLKAGADVKGVMRPKNSRGKAPKNGTSPLLLAVENGHYDLAVELLESGADPNDSRSGYTILHSLTWIRKPDIGESANGDPKPEGSGRRTSKQFIRELVSYGADVNFRLTRGRKAGGARFSEIGATPFFMASDRADLTYMKLLVELGADPMISNSDGTTPLMVAAGIGSQAPEEEAGSETECLAAVKYLVSLGAEINTVDARGETAMHGAAYKNLPSMAKYLNSIGADIKIWNTANKMKRTPLLIAQGYRPGNFKPSFATVAALKEVMLANGVKPPAGPKPSHTRKY